MLSFLRGRLRRALFPAPEGPGVPAGPALEFRYDPDSHEVSVRVSVPPGGGEGLGVALAMLQQGQFARRLSAALAAAGPEGRGAAAAMDHVLGEGEGPLVRPSRVFRPDGPARSGDVDDEEDDDD